MIENALVLARKLEDQLKKVIVGQDETIHGLLAALFTGGHVLLEGVPGTAKTLLVRALARAVGADFRRIQFTPDLMPSDLLGTNVFNAKLSDFQLRRGPVFTNLCLADEINRAPAKTQSALLEAMEERQVTIDGTTYPLSAPFMVIATQNPVEYEGTYPLPEAQLDRFAMKLLASYPTEEEEQDILRRHREGFDPRQPDSWEVEQVASGEDIVGAQAALNEIIVEDALLGYITGIARRTRESPHLLLGASPRAGVALLSLARAWALLRERTFVIPDDIKEAALPCLRHRVMLRAEAEIEGITPDQAVRLVLESVEVPK